nr:hypothetical protein CFP56_46145 [Quercus suber]
MDNLSALWETFSLTESKGSKYHVEDGDLEGKFLLAVQFFTSRKLNIEAIARTFKLLWHTKKGFEARDMGDHRVLFIFSEKFDVDRVLASEPWSFDKYLVALKPIGHQTEMKGLVFNSVHLWLQVHNLPIGCLKLRVAQDIASLVGDVINTGAVDEDYEGSHFLRVRVRIDIRKPLCRGRKIGLSTSQQRSSTSQSFQAQLDDIDVELGSFNGGKENGEGTQDFMINGVGDRGGGLALLWKAGTAVWMDNFSNYHIDSIVHGGLVNAWKLTGFYGELDTGR